MNKDKRNNGNLPTLSVSGENIPEAWEKAVLAVYNNGVPIKTEYDKPEDPPSLDATVMVEVVNPLGEPMIHKNFPGGPVELERYRQEVVDGIHDHWINPKEGKWTYTYHQRLFEYQAIKDAENTESPFEPRNQIKYMIDKLSESGFSRRAQAVTWMPHSDPDTNDPPCLQRLWARILKNEKGEPVLNLNSHWRSRDLYKAWFMNSFAMSSLHKFMSDKISEKTGEEVQVGRYVDIADSLHIYGSYRTESLEEEICKMENSSYTERAWDSSMLEPIFQEVRENLKKDPDFYSKGDR